MWKKVLSVLLTVTIVFSSSGIQSFAASNNVIGTEKNNDEDDSGKDNQSITDTKTSMLNDSEPTQEASKENDKSSNKLDDLDDEESSEQESSEQENSEEESSEEPTGEPVKEDLEEDDNRVLIEDGFYYIYNQDQCAAYIYGDGELTFDASEVLPSDTVYVFLLGNITSIGDRETSSSYYSCGRGPFAEVDNLEYVIAPYLTSIGDSAFAYCSDLYAVYMPKLKTISKNAFYQCGDFTGFVSGNDMRLYLESSEMFESDDDKALKDKYISESDSDLGLIETIGNGAFYYTYSLSSIDFSLVETIGDKSFYSSALDYNLYLPKVKSIGDEAFYYSEITGVNMSVVESIGWEAFYSSRIVDVYIPDTYKTDYLEGWTFLTDTLKSIRIPEGVKQVGIMGEAGGEVHPTIIGKANSGAHKYAKERFCDFICEDDPEQSIIVPKHGDKYTDEAGNEYVYYSPSGSKGYYEINSINGANKDITIPDTANGYEVRYFSNSFSIKNPEKIESIEFNENISYLNASFSACKNLKTVTVLGSVIISESNFSGCENLTTFVAGDGVKFSKYSFANCKNLHTVEMGNKCTIESDVFAGCDELSEIYMYGVEYTATSNVFKGLENVIVYSTKESGMEIYCQKAGITFVQIEGKEDIEKQVIDGIVYTKIKNQNYWFVSGYDPLEVKEVIEIKPTIDYEKVSYVIQGAFYGCDKIKEVVISSAITLREYSFGKNDNLEKISISGSAVVETNTFTDCESIKEISLSNCEVKEEVFSNCSNLEKLTIYNTNIGERAFYNCDSLESITFDYRSRLSKQTFADCDGIKEIRFGTYNNIAQNAFENCKNLTSVYIGDNSYVYENAFLDCDNLKNVEFGYNCTIYENAFKDSKGLENVVLGNKSKIYNSAFEACENLKSVYIGNDCTMSTYYGKDNRTFADCVNLEFIRIGSNSSIGDNTTYLNDSKLARIYNYGSYTTSYTRVDGVFDSCPDLIIYSNYENTQSKYYDFKSGKKLVKLELAKKETSSSFTSITLTWNSIEGLPLTYDVYRGSTTNLIGSTQLNSYVDTDLDTNRTYTYYIKTTLETGDVLTGNMGSITTSSVSLNTFIVDSLISAAKGTTLIVKTSTSDKNLKGSFYYYKDSEAGKVLINTPTVKADGTYQYRWYPKDMPSGNYTILFELREANNSLVKKLSGKTYLDTAVPTIKAIAPATGGKLNGTQNFEFNVTDDYGVGGTTLSMSYDNKTWKALASGTTTLKHSINFDTLEPGKTVYLKVSATDKSGNTAEWTAQYIVAQVEVESIETESVINKNGATLIAKILDNEGVLNGKTGVFYYLNNNNSQVIINEVEMTGLSEYKYTWKPDGIASGNYTIGFKIKDSTESKTKKETKTFIDVKAPAIKGISPYESIIHSIVEVGVYATDDYGIGEVSIYVSCDSQKSWDLLGTSNDANKKYYYDTLNAQKDIFIKAIVKDTAGNESEEVIKQYLIDNEAPAVPSNIETDSTINMIEIMWEKNKEKDFSYVLVEQMKNGEFVEIAKVRQEDYFILKNLLASTIYEFRLAAVDTVGNKSEYTEVITIKTEADNINPVVSNISPAPGYYKDSIALWLTGSDNCGIKMVEIQTSRDLKKWEPLYKEEFTASSNTRTVRYTYDVSKEAEGSVYVRGIVMDMSGNISDTSDKAPYSEYIIDRTAPSAPTGLSSDENETGYIRLMWNKGPEKDLYKYSLFRSDDGKDYGVVRLGIAALSCYDETVKPGKTYWYQVVVSDMAGNVSEPSQPIKVTAKSDTTKPEIISVYPSNGSTIGSNSNVSVLAYDNCSLSELTVEYSINDEKDRHELIHKTSIAKREVTVQEKLKDGSLKNGDKVTLFVQAKDESGNKSEMTEVSYTADYEVTSIEVTNLQSKGNGITVGWRGEKQNDTLGYTLYRVDSNGRETLLARFAYNSEDYYGYEDNNITKNGSYSYRIRVEDAAGNTNEIVSEKVEYDVLNSITPILTGDSVIDEGDVASFNASNSYADRKIISYSFDFGDGSTPTTSTNSYTTHVYDKRGTYTVKLTITDERGNSKSATKTIEVKEHIVTGTVNVVIVDESGNRVSGMPVYFDMENNLNQVKGTQGDGRVQFKAVAGKYTIGAYKSGYLPVTETVTVENNKEITITLKVIKEDIVTGELTVERMTLDEIKAAGINIADPANQQVVKVNVELTYGETHLSYVQYHYPKKPNEAPKPYVTQVYDKSGEKHQIVVNTIGGSNFGYGYTDNDPSAYAVAILDIPLEASWLKEFFDVKLTLINNADAEFVLENNKATLNVPDGMTLVETNFNSANPTVTFDSLPGQTEKEIRWTLRGDKEGDYKLSANYESVLTAFNAPVSATFEAQDPIKVYGTSAVKMIVDVNNRLVRDTLYFNVSLENISEVPVYNPKGTVNGAIEAFNNANKDPESNMILDAVELGFYKVDQAGNETEVKSVEELLPGERIMTKYAVYNIDGFENKLMTFKKGFAECNANMQVEINVIEVPIEDECTLTIDVNTKPIGGILYFNTTITNTGNNVYGSAYGEILKIMNDYMRAAQNKGRTELFSNASELEHYFVDYKGRRYSCDSSVELHQNESFKIEYGNQLRYDTSDAIAFIKEFFADYEHEYITVILNIAQMDNPDNGVSNVLISVVDEKTNKPIPGMEIIYNKVKYHDNNDGLFSLITKDSKLDEILVHSGARNTYYESKTIANIPVSASSVYTVKLKKDTSFKMNSKIDDSVQTEAGINDEDGKRGKLIDTTSEFSIDFSRMKISSVFNDANDTIKIVGAYNIAQFSSEDDDPDMTEEEKKKLKEKVLDKYEEYKQEYEDAKKGGFRNDKDNIVQGKFVLEGSISVQLFAELGMENGQFKILDGGVLFGAQIKGTYKYMVYPLLLAELSLEFSAEGRCFITFNNLMSLDISGTIDISGELCLTVCGGVDFAKAGIGASGKITVKLALPAAINKLVQSVEADLSLFITGTLLCFSAKKEIAGLKLELYPNPGLVDVRFIGKGRAAVNSERALRMLAEDAVDLNDELTITGDPFEDAQPEMVQLDDGTTIAVWLIQDTNKAYVNSPTLVYSVNKGKGWSKATPVYKSSCADYYPNLVTDGKNAYLSYIRMDSEFDNNVSKDEYFKHTDVYLTTYANGSFNTPVLVSEQGNDILELNTKIAVNKDTVTVSWVENSNNDPYSKTGTDRILTRTYKSGKSGEIVTAVDKSEHTVSFDTQYFGRSLYVAYISNGDVFINHDGKSEQITNDNVDDTNVRFNNNDLYWSSGFEVMRMKDGKLSTIEDTGVHANLGFDVISNGDITAICFAKENGAKSEIFMSKDQGNGFGEAVPVSDFGERVGDFAAILTKNGELNAIVSEQSVYEDEENFMIGNSSVDMYDNLSATNVILESASIENYNIEPGKNTNVYLVVNNMSSNHLNSIEVSMDGQISKVDCDIAPGTTGMLTVDFMVPNTIQSKDIKITVKPVDFKDNNLSDNSATVHLGYGDIELVNVKTETTASGVLIKGDIVNNGYDIVNDIKFNILHETSDGKELYSEQIESLAVGQTHSFAANISSEYAKFMNGSDGVYYYLKCYSDDRENDYANNSQIVTAFPIQVTGITGLDEQIIVGAGSSYKLNAKAEPEEAFNQNVYYTSENTGVAEVGKDGLVIGISKGTTIIRAFSSDGQFVEECTVIVTEGISLGELNVSELTLEKGDTFAITYTTDEDVKVTWESLDDTVVTVSDGNVTAVGSGCASIKVTASDGFVGMVYCTVSDNELQALLVDKEHIELNAGDTYTQKITFYPESAQNVSLTWTSTNEAVATVSEEGVITAVSGGNTQIIVTADNGVTLTIKVDVESEEVYEVTFDYDYDGQKKVVTVNDGEKLLLPESITRQDYTFNGWYTQRNGKGTQVTGSTVVQNSFVCYAYWTVSRQDSVIEIPEPGDNEDVEEPSTNPSEEPGEKPSEEPSDNPSEEPSDNPSDNPSEDSSEESSESPSEETPATKPDNNTVTVNPALSEITTIKDNNALINSDALEKANSGIIVDAEVKNSLLHNIISKFENINGIILKTVRNKYEGYFAYSSKLPGGFYAYQYSYNNKFSLFKMTKSTDSDSKLKELKTTLTKNTTIVDGFEWYFLNFDPNIELSETWKASITLPNCFNKPVFIFERDGNEYKLIDSCKGSLTGEINWNAHSTNDIVILIYQE